MLAKRQLLSKARAALRGITEAHLSLLQSGKVQGVRFDPWVSAGLGFRETHGANESFTGIDWARLQVGGDWYATSQFGFGPLIELSLGTFVGSSGSNLETKAVDAHFVIGGRIVFDSPGK